jgi:outer membrane immunogenic protein
MNKLIGILTSAVLTTSAYASSNNDMTGLYVGGNIGYGSGTNHILAEDEDVPGDVMHLKSGMKGMGGGLHLGFQQMFNNLVAGIETSASLNNSNGIGINMKNGTENLRISVKRKNSFGVSGRLGTIINNWLVYGKIGYENAKFCFSAKDESESEYKSRRLNGFVPGIGFETLLTQNVMLGAEWSYAMYKNKNFDETKIKARVGDFKLRVSYKF